MNLVKRLDSEYEGLLFDEEKSLWVNSCFKGKKLAECLCILCTGTQTYLEHNQQSFKDILGVGRIGILKLGRIYYKRTCQGTPEKRLRTMKAKSQGIGHLDAFLGALGAPRGNLFYRNPVLSGLYSVINITCSGY